MKLSTEEIKESPSVLFIYDKSYPIIAQLSKKLKTYNFKISSSSYLKPKSEEYKYIFIFGSDKIIEILLENPIKDAVTIIILFNKFKKLEKLSETIEKGKYRNTKIINLDLYAKDEKTAEKILWFTFSDSGEKILNLEGFIEKAPRRLDRKKTAAIKFNKKKIFVILAMLLLFLEFFFVIPLSAAGILVFKGIQAVSAYDMKKAINFYELAGPFLSISKSSYQFSRPLLSFLSLSILPDNLISSLESGYALIGDSVNTSENAKKIIALILKTDKSQEEQNEIVARLDKLKLQTKTLSEELESLSQQLNFKIKKIENIKTKLKETKIAINQVEKILFHVDKVIGGKEEKKYLILFQNNMEIRPGGGFIGSFGIATFSNYTLSNFRIEDVYVADGQLKEHIEPPSAIRKYLDQPNWFLRDSNFSPDFPANFNQASFFLEKELNIKNFDGGIGITTTAITYIIGAFDEVYIPDYNEIVNSDNFYIKAQTYAEKDFFPGSTSKRNFLSSVSKILTLKLEEASFKDLGAAIKRSLDEKHIVLYFKDQDLQKDINSLGWVGKVVTGECASQLANCISDRFFAFDANLGVNKANFFVSRHLKLKIHIKEDGEIRNTLNLIFKNESDKDAFPGGIYKNFFQVYLPVKSTIQKVTLNNVLVKNYNESESADFKAFSYYFEVPPTGNAELQITYLLHDKIVKGKSPYQLIIQKQIGALNNDLSLEFVFPPTIHVLNQNFPAIAKKGGLNYNTSLSTDRIFFIEFLKE